MAPTARSRLLFTSTHVDAYKLLLNCETGDEAVVETRSCGCPWERFGWTRHVHSVQSFEKLTLEGMTYASDAFFRLVEETLPARCGGTPADYQIVEGEDGDGLTRLVVSVSPSLAVDEEVVRRIVLSALADSTPALTPMTELLRRASAVSVRREHPRLTASGKILTVRSARASSGSSR